MARNPIMNQKIRGQRSPTYKVKLGGKGIHTTPRAPKKNAAYNVRVKKATTRIKPVRKIT